jgi:epoxyqueuosine reductase QueG
VDAFGFAPVDRFEGAPPRHHPAEVLKGARTVIVYAKAVPRGCFSSPEFELHFLHRSYHTIYPYLDQVGLDLIGMLESEGGLGVEIPAYAPLTFEEGVSRGILSLKHAAVAAGLGAFGHCGLTYHPEHGSMLRFGAVITTVELTPSPLLDHEPCPDNCRACEESCPAAAFQDGVFQRKVCTGFSIRHPIYPLALKEEWGLASMELIANTAGYNYWVSCCECLKVCPANESGSKSRGDSPPLT